MRVRRSAVQAGREQNRKARREGEGRGNVGKSQVGGSRRPAVAQQAAVTPLQAVRKVTSVRKLVGEQRMYSEDLVSATVVELA